MTTAHEPDSANLSEILARLSAGRDPEAWTALLHGAGPDMQRLARRLMGEAALADDALQEALLHIRDRAGQFMPTAAGDADRYARRWIMRLTTNICISMLRSRQRSRRFERAQRSERADQAAPPEIMERSEQAALLRRELARLPAGSSTAIVLHHIGGQSFEEIAESLGVPVGTAKTKVRRGLIALRERLARVGVAMSLTVLTQTLSELPAVEGGAALTAYSALLHSPLKATAITTASVGGITLSGVAAIVIGLVALGATAIVAVTSAGTQSSEAVATAVPRTEPVQPVKPVILFAADFEDGTWPAGFLPGEVVPGPARDGNRFCAKGGERIHNGQLQKEITCEPPRGPDFITFAPGMRLDFDCWFTAETGLLAIASWNLEQQTSLFVNLVEVTQGQWVHVSVALDELHDADQIGRFQPGEHLGNLGFAIGARPDDQLYIDNITITQP